MTTTSCCSRPSRRSPMRRLLPRSSSVVGSSATRIVGPVASTPASASSCPSPPDSPCTLRSPKPASPKSARTRSATTSLSALSRCVRRSDRATSSRAVGITSWAAGSVNTKPTRRRTSRPSRATSRPSTTTRPVVAGTRPLRSRARVDLPEPLGPTSATRRSVSSSEVSWRMRRSPSWVGTETVTCSRRIPLTRWACPRAVPARRAPARPGGRACRGRRGAPRSRRAPWRRS